MKKTISWSLLLTCLLFTVFYSCKKSTTTPADPCTNTSIVINETVVDAIPCETTAVGSITVTASGSTGFTYNKNGGTYQSSNVFSGLSAGLYTIGVKDANGCTNTKAVTVSNASQGTNFTNVRTIINSKCASGCHLNGGSDGGVNFDDYCNIVTKWSRINVRCVTQGNMPPTGLTTAQKAQITAWVNAGHKYSD